MGLSERKTPLYQTQEASTAPEHPPRLLSLPRPAREHWVGRHPSALANEQGPLLPYLST